jgi:hypothetical protein
MSKLSKLNNGAKAMYLSILIIEINICSRRNQKCLSDAVITSVGKWGYVKIHQSMSKPQNHAILAINEESRKWSLGSKKNAKNTWGLLEVIRPLN